MIIGFTLGFIVSLFFIPLALILVDSFNEHVVWLLSIIGMILTTAFGTYLGYITDVNEYNKKIESWKNTKEIIEASMNNENISDLEKIDLVNKIVEYNTQLTDLKEDVKQWWYFYLDDTKVNDLEIIKINN